MTRLVLAASVTLVTLLGGCPRPRPAAAPGTAGGGSNAPAVMAKKLSLSWGITVEPGSEMSKIFLATTDETGKQVSHQVGTYKGRCAAFAPAADMKALTGVACTTGGGGTELHAVHRVDEVIILQMGTTPGATPDPMAREEVTRIQIPTGVAVEVAR